MKIDIYKDVKLVATVEYKDNKIVSVNGSEKKKFKSIFNKTYSVVHGGESGKIFWSGMREIKPGDNEYITYVVLDIVVQLGYDIKEVN